MRIGYILDTLTSVDIQKIVKIGGKVIQIYEGFIYQENFMISPLRKNVQILLALRQKYKDDGNVLMEISVKLITNSLYGVQLRKDIN